MKSISDASGEVVKQDLLTLRITFLPSGMVVRSTSILAKASTSAEAERLAMKSETTDLAPAAVRAPMAPTAK